MEDQLSPNLSIYHNKILPCSQTSLSRRRHEKKASHIWQIHKQTNIQQLIRKSRFERKSLQFVEKGSGVSTVLFVASECKAVQLNIYVLFLNVCVCFFLVGIQYFATSPSCVLGLNTWWSESGQSTGVGCLLLLLLIYCLLLFTA